VKLPRLSTTSYAVLSLLAVRRWTTYELAQQMQRSLRDMWPRAESVVYEEPKRLTAARLAKATVQHTGRRASTVYTITAAGRRALRNWFDQPGAGPVLEFEALLQVAFADHGTHEQLVRTLQAIRDEAERRCEHARTRVDEYAQTGGPYPQRLPVVALAARFHVLQAETLLHWALWALDEVSEWTGTTPQTGARVPASAFQPPATHGTQV